MPDPVPAPMPPSPATALDTEFHRGLGLFDATMIVAGNMIGSGIFIVSANMAGLIGSPGWLLVAWLITGVLTVTAALSYGELASMMPRAGGQYVYLREAYSPLWGFLYGWTFVLVIQAGSIAAVAVAFARYAGEIFPQVAENSYLIAPLHVTQGYAWSLSTAQFVAILMILVLTGTNMLGVLYGKLVQNLFTVAKVGGLLGLIVVGITLGYNADAVNRNLAEFWTPRPTEAVSEGLTAVTAFGLFAALCVAQTGSLFSADAWNNVTFIAGEIRNPHRNLPWALGLGTGLVIALYLLANVTYLITLPLEELQNAPLGRVATASLAKVLGETAVIVMAAAIMVSTFGCNNGLILAGARASYAMARDGLFFPQAARLNAARVPAWGLALQGIWAALLVLPRTRTGASYGNLYNDLLDYVVAAALLFYILTILGLFRLRATRPDAERPYRAFGYPLVPLLYVVGASILIGMLVIYRPMTTWPGLVIVALGVPVYFASKKGSGS